MGEGHFAAHAKDENPEPRNRFVVPFYFALKHGPLEGPLSMPIFIPLVRESTPLYRQVYLRLREAILSGAFAQGSKLPSTRDLAEQMGISRTVAVTVYEQLLAEGFVVGRTGAGTYVSSDLN